MNLKHTALITLALLGGFGSARSGAAPLTIASAAELTRTNNPELASARYTIDEARARLQQSGRLANPELGAEFKPNVRGREGSWELGFSQKLPLTSRLRLERSVSRADIQVAEAEVRELERKLVLETRLAAVRLAALDTHRELRARQLANSRELAEASRKAAARGEAPAIETAQLELETAQLEAQQIELDAERATAVEGLRLLTGLNPGDSIEFHDTLPAMELPPATEPSNESHPDTQAAAARVHAARERIELTRAERWEDATVGLFGEVERDEDEPAGRSTDGFVGVRLSLPLPFWNRHEGRRQEAEAAARRAEADATVRARHIRADARTARSEMTSALALASNLSTNLLPRAIAIEDRLRSQIAQGQVTFSEMLRARERRLTLEGTRLDLLRDFHLARVRHESATRRQPSTR